MTYGKGVALVLGAGILWSAIGIVVRQIDEARALYRLINVLWRLGLHPIA